MQGRWIYNVEGSKCLIDTSLDSTASSLLMNVGVIMVGGEMAPRATLRHGEIARK
jgi:hypothetical protein